MHEIGLRISIRIDLVDIFVIFVICLNQLNIVITLLIILVLVFRIRYLVNRQVLGSRSLILNVRVGNFVQNIAVDADGGKALLPIGNGKMAKSTTAEAAARLG